MRTNRVRAGGLCITFAGVCVLAAVAVGAGDAAPAATAQASGPVIVSVFMEGPEDILALTHGGHVPLAPYPPDIETLTNGAEANLALIAKVRDAEGQVIGVASELEEFPQAEQDIGADMEPWQTYWTVLLTGRGALYGYHLERINPEHLAAIETSRAGEDWVGEIPGVNTVGPAPGGKGYVFHGTGEFEGMTGFFQERTVLRGVSADGVLDATLELRFELE